MILDRLPQARLVGLDVDAGALAIAAETLRRFGPRVTLRQGSYARIDEHLRDLGTPEAVFAHGLELLLRGLRDELAGYP